MAITENEGGHKLRKIEGQRELRKRHGQDGKRKMKNCKNIIKSEK